MADRLGEVKASTYRAPAELPTLKTVAEALLTSKSTEGLRPSTIAGLENHMHDHIVPAIGAKRVDLVTLADVESLRKGLVAEKKLAPRTVNKALAAMKAIFGYAVSAGYITRNPGIAVKAMKLGSAAEVTEEQVPSAEEVSKLIDSAREGLPRAFVLAASLTGAREGELVALQWDDVDLEARTLTIRRSDSWARTRAERAAKEVKGARTFDPKTDSGRRVVRIDDEIVRELRRWKLQHPRGARGLVFPNAAGEPLHRRTLYKQHFGPAMKTAGLEGRFTVHSLRHFHASALLLAGVPIAEVSNRLGHKNPAITMKVYTHFIRGAESKAAETIAGLIRSAREGPRSQTGLNG